MHEDTLPSKSLSELLGDAVQMGNKKQKKPQPITPSSRAMICDLANQVWIQENRLPRMPHLKLSLRASEIELCYKSTIIRV